MRRGPQLHNEGDEWDAFTRWRKLLCVFDRPHVAARTKRRYRRRERRWLARLTDATE